MKRIISMLLCLVMILSCLSGCSQDQSATGKKSSRDDSSSNDSNDESKDDGNNSGDNTDQNGQSDRKTESVENVLGFNGALAEILTQAVVMRMESEQAFVAGSKTQLSENPFVVDGISYIPGGFVTKGLGGTAESNADTNIWNIELQNKKWTVNTGSGTVKQGDSQLELKHPIVGLAQDFMISAEDYSQITGMDSVSYDQLILVGNQVNGVFDDLPEEGSDMMLGLLNNHLSTAPVSGMTAGMQGNWDRREVSHNIDIDPWCIPYTSPEGYLVAVSGNLYVEDLSFRKHPTNEDYYVCSMTVYNTGLTYGAAESYSADNKLIDRDMIEAYGGRYESVISSVVNSAIMVEGTVKWIATGDMSDVEYRIAASENTVSLNVPKDGYVFVTTNPNYSKAVAAFNTVLFYSQALACTTEVNPMIPDGCPLLRNMITNCAVSAISEDSAVIEEIADIFYQLKNDLTNSNMLDSDEYIKTVCMQLSNAVKKSDYDLNNLMEDALETAIAELQDSADTAVTNVISYVPVVGQALETMEIYADVERLLGMCHELTITQSTTPIVLSACDWRTAYAQLLREYSFSKEGALEPRFGLCYIDANSIPELVVMEGASTVSQAYVFTYRNGEILKREEKAPAYMGTMVYYEFGDILMTYSLRYGYEGFSWSRFLDPDAGDTYLFNNDYFAVGEDEDKATYKYQGKEVAKWYYDYMVQKVENKFSQYEQIGLHYDDSYEITEGNIKSVIEKY